MIGSSGEGAITPKVKGLVWLPSGAGVDVGVMEVVASVVGVTEDPGLQDTTRSIQMRLRSRR